MGHLLLINFDGSRFGIWEDALTAVRPALPLHRLPLSPPAIAGIALLDDRSAVIADLAACLGFPPLRTAPGGTFLVIDPGEKIAGFVVEGAVDRVEHPADGVLPLPDTIRTPVIDTCAVVDHATVPIVNIRALQERLKQGSMDLPHAAGFSAAASDGDPARAVPVRAFLIGGERFCINAAGTTFEEVAKERIARLPLKDEWLAGITVHDDAVLPLIRLDDLLGSDPRGGRSGILLAGAEGGRHGLLVDEDLGTIEQQDLRICGLPALARLPGMPAAAVSSGKVYPLIDAGRTISDRKEREGEREARHAFSPASSFSHRFRKNEVEVVEFSLLGEIHAVPKEEVKEVHPLLPITRVPHAAEIVMGVAVLNEELLPVLDLAAVFGRRSAVNRKWRMVHIANGDFHALVVTDEVRGDRRLSLEDQRQLPLALPYQVLYGCYLDAGKVRLIMNVLSLAVHFEKASVRELVSSFSPDMAVPEDRNVPAAPAPAAALAEEEEAEDRVQVPGPEPQPAVSAEHPEQESVADVRARLEEASRRHREAAARAREEAKQREEAEKRRMADETRARVGEQARLQEAEARLKALDEQRNQEENARRKADEEARAKEEARKREREAALRKTAEEARKRQEAEAEQQAEEQARAVAEEARIRAERQSVAQGAPSPGMPEAADVPHTAEERSTGDRQPAERKRGSRIGIAAMLALALALVIYFAGMPERPAPPEPVKPAKIDAPAPVLKKEPQVEKIAPLYLTVPPDRAAPEQTVYIVVKGDTLWGIAKRFTGNPLNYPRVAKDNSIATPDLIFPGQRIRLVQEKR